MLKWATTGKSAPQTSFYLFFPENITVVRSNARSGSFSRMKTKIYRNFCLCVFVNRPACIHLSPCTASVSLLISVYCLYWACSSHLAPVWLLCFFTPTVGFWFFWFWSLSHILTKHPRFYAPASNFRFLLHPNQFPQTPSNTLTHTHMRSHAQ